MRTLIVTTVLLALIGTAFGGPTDDEYEPNDTCATATPNVVFVGAEWSLYLETDNEDWFEFEIPEGGPLTIQTAKGFTIPYAGDTILEIYADPCEEVIAANDDIDAAGGDLYSAVHLALAPGTMIYIRVRTGDRERPAGSYRLECYGGVVPAEAMAWSRVKAQYR